MPTFTYVGGKTPSAHVLYEPRDDRKQPLVVSTDANGDPIADERDEHAPEAPNTTTAFGLTFVMGRPVEVTQAKFKTKELYEHAVRKLRINRFFEEVVEDAEIVEETPAPVRKKPGPKPKVEAAA